MINHNQTGKIKFNDNIKVFKDMVVKYWSK